MATRPFSIDIPEPALADLRHRLLNTRWPKAIGRPGWEDGADDAYLRDLVDHWLHRFDWRAQERRLNRLPQFTADIDGAEVHFVHHRGEGANPIPLLLGHGWPGSFIEFERVIPMLARPGAFGAREEDAFHVVVPSLPGFGFSKGPAGAGWGQFEAAGCLSGLMRDLGYARYALQGGDLGAGIATWMARRFPSEVIGLHLNYLPGSYRPGLGAGQAPLSQDEESFLDRSAQWSAGHGGYAQVQGTRPRTLAFGLDDSPVGQAAWILDKFHAWSDCRGDLDRAFRRDDLLSNVCLYWLTGTAGSAMQIYKESRSRPLHFEAGERIVPPLGMAVFPHEISHPPRSWVARVFDIQRWSDMPRGGHFAALEQPDLFVEDIRAFFRPFRRQRGRDDDRDGR